MITTSMNTNLTARRAAMRTRIDLDAIEIVTEEPLYDGGAYAAYSPDVPGIVETGRTEAEARQRLRDALRAGERLPVRRPLATERREAELSL